MLRRVAPLLLAACAGADDPPAWPGEAWEVRAPEDDGLDPAPLQEAVTWAFSEERATQALLVVHRGRIVAEAYDPEHGPDDLATTWSMAKSFASVLVGIAVDDGLLTPEQTLVDAFPAWAADDRAAIDLDTLLAMRSGLDWGSPPNEEFSLFLTTPDQLAPSVDRQLVAGVGERWAYASGDAMLVSGVLQHATGVPVGDYAEERLFGPLGMSASWWTDVAGHALTYCCVDATPRDLARFGLMAARGGRWGERQVVSEAWLEHTTAPQDDAPWYGRLWWTYANGAVVHGQPVRAFVADGLGHQRIHVFPTLDLVVVRVVRYSRTGTGHVRSGTTMPITPATTTDVWSDTELLTRVLRSLDPDAQVSSLCDVEGNCGAF